LLSATAFGIAALWAAIGRGGWLVRIVPITLMLAAMLPIGAYELLALVLVQSAIVVGSILAWRSFVAKSHCVSEEVDQPSAARFGLRDLMAALVLVSLVLACVHYRAPSTVQLGTPIDWWPWFLCGGVLGINTVASAILALGTTRWYLRLPTWIVIVAVCGIVMEQQRSTLNPMAKPFLPFPPPEVGWWVGVTVLQAALIALWTHSASLAGWLPSRHILVPQTNESLTSRRCTIWQCSARTIAVVGVLLLLGVLGEPYRALIPPPMPSEAPLPVPNGYDGLLDVARQLNWNAIPLTDVDGVSDAACQQFSKANVAAFANLRLRLREQSRVPQIYSANFSPADLQAMRSLARALSAQARAAAAEARYADAARASLDMLRLSRSMSREGAIVDFLVGSAIKSMGLTRLAEQLPRLDPDELREVVADLQADDKSREPLAEILARDWLVTRLAYGWIGRLDAYVETRINGPESERRSIRDVYERRRAFALLIATEAAVRRYILECGAPPDSLAALAPEYLRQIPDDPLGNGPFIYRRTADGYVLYSVGGNRVDDGGQRVSLVDSRETGDLFFDAPEN
jgi:hypothetical protein